ncbi:Polygalacturonase [Handroanthus impetiginosus]|uniref:Polygalacturonase n=1 Tax=Handroanthus impetiginosus TaxID=429701 RepID=A0A2G9GQK1_9LAMI|nr:Polygalacturonase [Handroanthus impetiginosus]
MNSGLLLQILSVLALSIVCTTHSTKVFNVHHYGAVADNKTDNTKAFMKAWIGACKWRGKSRVLIPRGLYYLGSVVFRGPCNGPKEFVIKGVLRAPTEPGLFFIDHWITFQNINRLKIYGRGTLDGQGAAAWPYNDCGTGSCKPLPVSLRLDFINDSDISNIKSINSKNFHFNVFSCYRLNFNRVTISAPQDSPNTDGIHVGSSGDITIDRADIATGDDCISIGPSSQGIRISNIFCGPGHGISVGSMGKSETEEGVRGVTVVNCTFRETLNGVQIKTWPDSKAAGGFASDFIYDNIDMKNVENPIFINQQYCPSNLCNHEGSSKIQVSNITFRNIWGTCTKRDAVKLVCSKSNPCHDIALENINIIGPGGLSSSSCSNVNGTSQGRQTPPSCLN